MSIHAVVQIRDANQTYRTLYVNEYGNPRNLGIVLAKGFQELTDKPGVHGLLDVPAMVDDITEFLQQASRTYKIGKVLKCRNSVARHRQVGFVYKAFIGPKSGVWKIHCKEGPFRNAGKKVYQGTPNQWMAKQDYFKGY